MVMTSDETQIQIYANWPMSHVKRVTRDTRKNPEYHVVAASPSPHHHKTIIRFGFCDIQNNQGLGKGYQPQPSASVDNSYLDLDYSGYHKNLIQ